MIDRLVTMSLVGSMALVSACGGGAVEATGEAQSGNEPAVTANPEKAAELANDADKARKRKKWDEARALLKQADPMANEAVRDEIRLVADRVDRDEAEALATDVIEQAKSGECGKALDDTAALAKLPGKGGSFVEHLLRFTAEPNLACLGKMIEEGKLRDVKLLADTQSAQLALGSKGHTALDAKIVEAANVLVMKKIDEPVKAKRWPEVVVALRELVKSGEATVKDVGPAMELVDKGVRAELAEIVDNAIGQPKSAQEALGAFDKLAAVLWVADGGGGKAPPGAGKLDPGPMPAEIVALRSKLAFWLACASVRCTETEPRQVWTYGHAPLTPTLEPKGKPGETVQHGTALWEIASAAGVVLVAKTKPGPLEGIAARAKPAWGWLPAANVRTEDTSEWLPPGDSLVGTRVWGPLRDAKEKLLEIGTVVGLEKGQVKVRRMADRQEVLVARGRLFFGAVKPGMRILAMCGGSLTPTAAKVESIRETKFEAQGDPVVKLTCLDPKEQPTSEVRNDQLGSVRTKLEWLPKAR